MQPSQLVKAMCGCTHVHTACAVHCYIYTTACPYNIFTPAKHIMVISVWLYSAFTYYIRRVYLLASYICHKLNVPRYIQWFGGFLPIILWWQYHNATDCVIVQYDDACFHRSFKYCIHVINGIVIFNGGQRTTNHHAATYNCIHAHMYTRPQINSSRGAHACFPLHSHMGHIYNVHL